VSLNPILSLRKRELEERNTCAESDEGAGNEKQKASKAAVVSQRVPRKESDLKERTKGFSFLSQRRYGKRKVGSGREEKKEPSSNTEE